MEEWIIDMVISRNYCSRCKLLYFPMKFRRALPLYCYECTHTEIHSILCSYALYRQSPESLLSTASFGFLTDVKRFPLAKPASGLGKTPGKRGEACRTVGVGVGVTMYENRMYGNKCQTRKIRIELKKTTRES